MANQSHLNKIPYPPPLLYHRNRPPSPPPLREQIHFFLFRTEWSSGHSAWMKKKRSLKCARSCGETFRFSNSLVCSNSHTKLYDTVVTYWQSWLAAPWSSQDTQVGLPRGARQAKYVSAWAKRKSNLRSQYWQTAVFLFTPCRVIKKKKKKVDSDQRKKRDEKLERIIFVLFRS